MVDLVVDYWRKQYKSFTALRVSGTAVERMSTIYHTY